MDTLAELFAHVITIFCTFGMICKKKYVIKTAVVYDEGIPNYVSLIVPIEHPLLEDIQATFESEIIMFPNNK